MPYRDGVSGARTLWEEGHEPGRQMVALGLALTLTVVAVDVAFGGGIGLFFDLAFVAVCVTLAMLVQPEDFFTVGVLPPLIMLVAFLLVGISRRAEIARDGDGLAQAVITGLSQHAVALGVGYAACLLCLAVRDQFVRSGRLV
jgi:acyl-homoserine lactone acylase PvdQ